MRTNLTAPIATSQTLLYIYVMCLFVAHHALSKLHLHTRHERFSIEIIAGFSAVAHHIIFATLFLFCWIFDWIRFCRKSLSSLSPFSFCQMFKRCQIVEINNTLGKSQPETTGVHNMRRHTQSNWNGEPHTTTQSSLITGFCMSNSRPAIHHQYTSQTSAIHICGLVFCSEERFLFC